MNELLRKYLPRYRGKTILGVATKMVEVVFDLITPLIVARMIDRGVANHDLGVLWHYVAMLFVIAVVGYGFTLVCQKMAAQVSQGVGTDLRHDLYQRINEFSAVEVDRFGTPSLVTRVTNDVNLIQVAIALGIRQLVRWPLLAVGSVVAAMMIDLRLGLIFLVCMPIIGVVFAVVMGKSVPYFTSMQTKLDRISLLTREALSGVRVVRAFGREDDENERFATAAHDQADTAIAVGKLSALLNPTTLLVLNLGVVAILWQGGIQVNAGEITQGEVMAFVNYMTQALTSIVYVANLVVVFTRGAASAKRLEEVLDTEPSIVEGASEDLAVPAAGEEDAAAEVAWNDAPGDAGAHSDGASWNDAPGEPSSTKGVAQASLGAKRSTAGGTQASLGAKRSAREAAQADSGAKRSTVPALAFDHASFHYEGSTLDALHDVTLDVPAGSTLGIIGGTGSGKSTLVSLVARLYDVSEGSVSIFGHDVRAYSFGQLRRLVAIVPQQTSLVSGTIRSNLCWRKPDATDDELWAALRVAQAEDFVRAKPDGLDEVVEAGGKNFSGGQRQRLTIARALVGNPRLVVLDDSASALDFATDAALRKSIRGLGRSLTSVIVSQRVSAVMNADQILVLDHGRLAGLGTHHDLLRTCPLYREICLSQLKKEEVEQ